MNRHLTKTSAWYNSRHKYTNTAEIKRISDGGFHFFIEQCVLFHNYEGSYIVNVSIIFVLSGKAFIVNVAKFIVNIILFTIYHTEPRGE